MTDKSVYRRSKASSRCGSNAQQSLYPSTFHGETEFINKQQHPPDHDSAHPTQADNCNGNDDHDDHDNNVGDNDDDDDDDDDDCNEPLSECGSSNNASALSGSDEDADDGNVAVHVEATNNSSRYDEDKDVATSVHTSELLRYKRHYPSLLRSFKVLHQQHTVLLSSVANARTGGSVNNKNDLVASTSPLAIESILDEFGLRKAGERDYKENKSIQSGEKATLLIAKRWKKRYYSLLEAVDVLYKDYLLLHRFTNCHDDLKSVLQKRKLSSDQLRDLFREEFHGLEPDSHRAEALADEMDVAVSVSTVFLSDLLSQCRCYQGDLGKQVQVNDRLFHVLKRAKEQRAKLKVYVNALRDELRYVMYKMRESQTSAANQLITQVEKPPLKGKDPPSRVTTTDYADLETKKFSPMNHHNSSVLTLQERIVELERILKEEENKRKVLHNKLQELIGNIRVYCRIRPHPNCFMKVSSDDKLIVPAEPLPDKVTRSWNTSMKCFIFDRVFGADASQEDVFLAVRELIVSCVDGYNVCIMAFGQTGSGKTHTMMGTHSNPGVNRRAVRHLLQVCQERKQWTYQLAVSMMEIYQEQIFDLLSPPHQKQLNVVKIMATQDDEVILQNLIEQTVRDENDVLKYLEMGEKCRRVASTMMNHSSSRSHFILLLHVSGVNEVHKTSSRGTLTLCDLAGSENVSKSGATGERFQEATSINRSLTALGRVFDLLRRRQKPCYRETKLTHLLKPTLGGDSKCLLIVNVRPEIQNIEESLRAIQFGQNAMQVAPEQMHQRSLIRSHSLLSPGTTESSSRQSSLSLRVHKNV